MDNKSIERYNVLVYPKPYSSKEEALKETALVKSRILEHPMRLPIVDIACAMVGGYTLSLGYSVRTPGYPKKHENLKSSNWINQQIFALDIDNADKKKQKVEDKYYLPHEKALDICNREGILPAFIYTTMSSTDEIERYRIVFVTDKLIDSKEDFDAVYEGLMSLFKVDGVYLSDTHVKEPSRLFFSGKKLIYRDFNMKVDTVNLIERGRRELQSKGNRTVTEQSLVEKQPRKEDDHVEGVSSIQPLIDHMKEEIETMQKTLFFTRECGRTLTSTSLVVNEANCRQLIDNIYYINTSKDIYTIDNSREDYLLTDGGLCQTQQPNSDKGYRRKVAKKPIYLLFDLPFNANIHCILPGHSDKRESARFEQDDNGDYFYHCYGCDERLYPIQLIQRLTGCSWFAAYKYLKFKFNIDYQTDWEKDRHEELIIWKDYITNKMQTDNITLYKIFKKHRLTPLYATLIDLAHEFVFDIDISNCNKIIFYVPNRRIALKMKEYGYVINAPEQKAVNHKIKILIKLGLLETIPDDLLPEKMIDKLAHIQEKDGRRFRIDCYHIPPLSDEVIDNAISIYQQSTDNNFSWGKLNHSSSIMENPALASKMYVQSPDKKLSKSFVAFYERCKHRAQYLLHKRGWMSIEQIYRPLRYPTSEKKRETYCKQCLPKIIQDLNLKKVSFSKQIETKYNIVNSRHKKYKLKYGSSKLLIKNE